jgi:GNAT superfamily N-acetyltransferase
MNCPISNKHHTIMPATAVEAEFIDNKIVEFNKTQVPFTQKQTPLFKNYVIKDNDSIIAGINACLYHWGILYIDVLFVDEKHRGKQLGRKLLEYVENEAIAMGATLSHLDTFDFQAKDFYLKYGYTIFGVLENCPKNHKRYYLSKPLSDGDKPSC